MMVLRFLDFAFYSDPTSITDDRKHACRFRMGPAMGWLPFTLTYSDRTRCEISFLVHDIKLNTHPSVDPGITAHGPYSIYNCAEKTILVEQDLDLMQTALKSVAADTHFGSASPAYEAFFKDSIYDTFVDEVISNVTEGAPLLKTNNPTTPQSPFIVCVRGPGIKVEDDGGERDIYDDCKNENWAAFYKQQTNWIFLCPLFFQIAQKASTPAAFCPAIVDDQFEENGQEGKLVQNQMWILMHELVHFYLDSSPGPATSDARETYSINESFRLRARKAISNAQSYVWYSACKYYLAKSCCP